MDRLEAYALLTEELGKLNHLRPDQLTALCENTVEIDHHGASGTFYRVELSVEQKASELIVIAGSVHDNNCCHDALSAPDPAHPLALELCRRRERDKHGGGCDPDRTGLHPNSLNKITGDFFQQNREREFGFWEMLRPVR